MPLVQAVPQPGESLSRHPFHRFLELALKGDNAIEILVLAASSSLAVKAFNASAAIGTMFSLR